MQFGLRNIKVWFVLIKDAKDRYPNNPLLGDGWGWALYLYGFGLAGSRALLASSCFFTRRQKTAIRRNAARRACGSLSTIRRLLGRRSRYLPASRSTPESRPRGGRRNYLQVPRPQVRPNWALHVYPAHPGGAISPRLRLQIFFVQERYDLIWVRLIDSQTTPCGLSMIEVYCR